jgi:hypothetical protein
MLLEFRKAAVAAGVDFFRFSVFRKLSHLPFSHGRAGRLMLKWAAQLCWTSDINLVV